MQWLTVAHCTVSERICLCLSVKLLANFNIYTTRHAGSGGPVLSIHGLWTWPTRKANGIGITWLIRPAGPAGWRASAMVSSTQVRLLGLWISSAITERLLAILHDIFCIGYIAHASLHHPSQPSIARSTRLRLKWIDDILSLYNGPCWINQHTKTGKVGVWSTKNMHVLW